MNIIQENRQKKDFYLLDVGTNNLAWAKGVIRFLKKNNKILSKFNFHIFVLLDSENLEEENAVLQDGNIQINAINITDAVNINEKNKHKRKFQFESIANNIGKEIKFDFIVSQNYLQSFVEAVDPLVYFYNLLNKNGYMLMVFPENLAPLRGISEQDREKKKVKIESLLLLTNSPFLVGPTKLKEKSMEIINYSPFCIKKEHEVALINPFLSFNHQPTQEPLEFDVIQIESRRRRIVSNLRTNNLQFFQAMKKKNLFEFLKFDYTVLIYEDLMRALARMPNSTQLSEIEIPERDMFDLSRTYKIKKPNTEVLEEAKRRANQIPLEYYENYLSPDLVVPVPSQNTHREQAPSHT